MKIISRIARQELGALFFSPIAWLILIIFAIQCGITFTDKLEIFESMQYSGTPVEQATFYMFSSGNGFLIAVQKYLYLYIPLLTMGLMSRETSSGTVKLLFSSPIRLRQIILGKYLAMMIYGLLLVCILMIVYVSASMSIEHMDHGLVLSGILGLYLVICAYAAIGLFMSCLTSYQMIAALNTLVVLAALNYIGGLWQHLPMVRDITYFLAINGRSEHFFRGLISSKDLFYFIAVIALFVQFSIMKLQGDRRPGTALEKVARYTVVVSVILLAGYFSARPALTLYLDTTATNSNTLTLNSQAILKQLKGPVNITAYVNALDGGSYLAMPGRQLQDMDNFDRYLRFKPDMTMKYVYFYDEVIGERRGRGDRADLKTQAERTAVSQKLDPDKLLSPAEIKKLIDLSPERNRFVRLVEYNGKKAFLRMYNDPEQYPGEAEVSTTLQKLLIKSPKVAFVTGHQEASAFGEGDNDYQQVVSEVGARSSLINRGFELQDLALQQQDIPADADVLVIADPRVMLTAPELAKIERYLAAGGNMLIAGEPGRQALINPVASLVGVQLLPGMLIQDTKNIALDYMLAQLTPAARTMPSYSNLAGAAAPVALPGAAGLQYDSSKGFTVTPVLTSSPVSNWIKKQPPHPDSLHVSFHPEQGDDNTVVPAALALTRQINNKEQRIIVMGDAGFMSNAEMGRGKVPTINFGFDLLTFDWLSYGRFPVNVDRPMPPDNRLLVNRKQVSMYRLVLLGILPGVIALFAVVLLLKRRRN